MKTQRDEVVPAAVQHPSPPLRSKPRHSPATRATAAAQWSAAVTCDKDTDAQNRLRTLRTIGKARKIVLAQHGL